MAHLMTIEEQFESALQRITALEEAQVKLATDLVKALSDLSAVMRSCASNAATAEGRAEDVSHYEGKVIAYHDAALMVDALSTGPVMQAALDALDARTPE